VNVLNTSTSKDGNPMTASAPIDPDSVRIPLWSTQGAGGGLALWDHLRRAYVWYTLPDWYADCPEITEQIGDPIPSEWGVIPANEAALDEMLR
jgi:hypothetical protein